MEPILKALDESINRYRIREMIRKVDLNKNGALEFEEFVEVSTSDIYTKENCP